MRLSLRHTYMPKSPVDFAGPSYFGGKNDQLVLCAGKGLCPLPKHTHSADLPLAGDVHIWDRESGTLLHHIRSRTVGGDLTCIAWNHAWDTFMFATGSHDGAVRIWTSPSPSTLLGSEVSSVFAASRATTNPTNTPGTNTPSPYDADYRSDSPVAQLSEPPDGLASSSSPGTGASTPGVLNTDPFGSGSAAHSLGTLPQARPSVVTFSSQVFGSS